MLLSGLVRRALRPALQPGFCGVDDGLQWVPFLVQLDPDATTI